MRIGKRIGHAFLKDDVPMLKLRKFNRKDAKDAKQSNAKFTVSWD